MTRFAQGVVLASVVGAVACGGGGKQLSPRPGIPRVSLVAGRPPVSVVEREGETWGALAVAVTTQGIAQSRGATAAVALAALVEERLATRGAGAVFVAGGWDGWRLRTLVGTPADATKLINATREAMLAPVTARDPALAAVARKVSALARRPLADRALVDVVRCTGEAFGMGDEVAPSATELESWRRAAHGLGRVAIAAAGNASLVNAVTEALRQGAAWPQAATKTASPWPASDEPAVVYDASGEVSPGAARIHITARTSEPERAVVAAPILGDPRGPLVSRLAALEAPGHVRSVVATAHIDGGCVSATVDLSARDLLSDASARVATAAVLARQELAVEMTDTAAPADLRDRLAMRSSDPREAAERAAWWALAGRRSGPSDPRLTLTVGVAGPRDPADSVTAAAPESSAQSSPRSASVSGESVRSEIDRATLASRAVVVEGRTRVEHGQGETWVLIASTCGTLPEASHDAGTGAAAATAAAMQTLDASEDTRIEPFVASDGVGLIAHGPARAGESPQSHARRIADAAARALAAVAIRVERVGRSRAALLSRAGGLDQRALAALGSALAPAHPSWIEPWGTPFGLGMASDEAIAARLNSIRSGPLRVAVLANSDEAQADAAVRAADRWVARRPGDSRACPPIPGLAAVRPGTYAIEIPTGTPSEVLLAFPLAVVDEPTRTLAAWTAAILDGPSGPLARAIGTAPPAEPSGTPLARAWSAAVVGTPKAPTLVVRVVSPDATLDAAVAQTRALLGRLQQGALGEDDRARAAAALAREAMTASLDPRARLIELWRGKIGPGAPPSLEALRAFAASSLRDDALIIVALRPARSE